MVYFWYECVPLAGQVGLGCSVPIYGVEEKHNLYTPLRGEGISVFFAVEREFSHIVLNKQNKNWT